MSLEQKIKSLVKVGEILYQFNQNKGENSSFFLELDNIVKFAEIKNPWFTQKNIFTAFDYWGNILTYENISNWISKYKTINNDVSKKTIGLILAGNIPMVGLHDCICVLITGHRAQIKLSSKDNILIPFILNLWKNFYKDLEFKIVEKLEFYDAVITTGSNNTAKYFEYYFKDIPHIIRKNRTSLAILEGNESGKDLDNLAKDIFTYFGLGCRNVTQIFIPENYNLDNIFKSFLPYQDVINHNKYTNNYEYNKAIYLMNEDKFWDNNFIMLKESEDLYSPIGVIFYKHYQEIFSLNNYISQNKNKIQCVVSNSESIRFTKISFGKTQYPKLNEYADGIDTIEFLLTQK